MHFFTKIIHAGVVLHVAFQGASSAILRGRSDIDTAQLGPHLSTRALTEELGDLNDQLGQFLDSYSTSHKRPSRDTTDDVNSVDIVIAKRQTVQIPQQALQDLLKLIQSIETQLTSILSAGGSSPSGGVGQRPSNAASNAVPAASSGAVRPSVVQSPNPPAVSVPASVPPAVSSPVNPPASNNPDVGPIVPSPFLTNTGSGPRDPVTTAYSTATTTGTRCKTTLTQTFTAYVYEDGTPAKAPVKARDEDCTSDGEQSDSEGSEEPPSFEVEEPFVNPREEAANAEEELDLDGDESLNVLIALRESRRAPDRSNLFLVREAEDAFEMMH